MLQEIFDGVEIGESASILKAFSEKDVEDFAKITGDSNPLHLDEKFAKDTIFGKRIVHGMLTGGLISAVIGTKFGPCGGIYLSQEMRFCKPVYIGDKVTVICTVLEKIHEKNQIIFSTIAINQYGEEVLTGKARILYKD